MKKTILLALLALIACSLPSGATQWYYTNGNYLVTSMTHDGQKLYVGTKYGLITIDKATGTQTLLNSSNSALPNDKVFSTVMHEGILWVGLDSAYVSEITPEQICNHHYPWNIFEDNPFPFEDDFPFTHHITSIAFGPSEVMYISQLSDFARVVNDQIEGTVRVGSTKLDSSGIEVMKVDANGVLWIVYNVGGRINFSLSRYTPEEGLVYPMADFDESLFPLGKDMMDSRAMDIDADGHVWIGCRGGYLAEYDGETFRFYELIVGVSPYVKPFGDLAFDANGTLWCIAYDGRLISRSGEEITVRQLELVEGEFLNQKGTILKKIA